MTKHTPSVPALTFHSTKFTITAREGQPWLRLPQIEGALGYTHKGKALSRIYRKHAAEFTDSMTAVVKLRTAGGMQDVRIFSLRGAHLLGMFARTERAAEFRRWVLDILDAQTHATEAVPAPLPPRGIRSRADLSMTACDSDGRLLNWRVPPRVGQWHEHVAIGEEWFAEVVQLAQYNPQEAYDALCCAGESGALLANLNWGHECGFMAAFARWAVTAMVEHTGEEPSLPFVPLRLGVPPREGFDHYRRRAAALPGAGGAY